MGEPTRYVINPMLPFPRKWRDPIGPIAVMAEPVKGYLMCKRPGAMPFVLTVRQILNTERHPVHGPFEFVPPKRRPSAGRSTLSNTEEG